MILGAKKVLEDRIRSGSNASTHTDLDAGLVNTSGTLVALINLATLLELVSETDVIVAKESMTSHHHRRNFRPFPSSSTIIAAVRFKSALLYHHTRTLRAPIVPAILRRHVESAVHEFPNNTALLCI